ncbi:FAD-binding protein [Pseudomonas putida]|uniref:FAD-binding protein n=1 Tax=Pseudomonas putida TaxID=303 RepID=A0A2Z4RGH3_PSEPU|nr:GMC family oxidoreductase N-terminal domain-containing protein [Pseudomonas putida]AWY40047.1 FAD-binding protein [Pseudomonas putida]
MNKRYDYIIVGAGSAGCVLANRLSSRHSVSVLLIESGPDDSNALIAMPRGIGKLLTPGNPHVWDYKVSRGPQQAEDIWLKGRAIGGSSSINGMVYVRGAPEDYDAWEAAGCTGWGWDNIGRHFVELEDHALGATPERGIGGPLKISVQSSGDPLCEAVLTAGVQAGTPRVDDINLANTAGPGGLGYQTQNIWNGQRYSAAKAFLDPVRNRPNLDVLTQTDVLWINFEDQRATSVTVRDSRGERAIDAGKEIIVCAGAIQSPKLLQLSGVGPAALLESHGIAVVKDAPQVGRNLREHFFLAMQYRVKSHSLNHRFFGLGLLRSVWQYYTGRKGPLTHSAHEIGGFVKTRPELDRPDAQIGISLYSLTYGEDEVVPEKQPGLTLGGYFMRPQSQGEVSIRSANPDVPPYICANYLDSVTDRAAAISMYRWIRQLASQPALAPFIVGATTPSADAQSDEEILEAFKQWGGTAYHVSGTCRMGSDAESVLDPSLKVRGVSGLRVVDTSIMPSLISGNTNAPAMAIALRAAEIIAAELANPKTAPSGHLTGVAN